MGEGEALFNKLHDAATATEFSGVVRVDVDAGSVFERAYGLADRAYGIPNTPSTRYSVASVTKGFTALVIGSLIAEGLLSLDNPVRQFLDEDLPLIPDDVTIEHLLTHRSGIGDYFDESESEDFNAYVMPVPVHSTDSTEHYLPALVGRPQVFAPGERFAYNNSGFVILVLIAERVSGNQFPELLTERVFGPAGMVNSGLVRGDELPGNVARGYLYPDGFRTNVLHLPVLGSGDGGAVTNSEDLAKFWRALFNGVIVNNRMREMLIAPISSETGENMRYARGFWRGKTNDDVILCGGDAGISAYTSHNPSSNITWTILSNTTSGAWDLLSAVNW